MTYELATPSEWQEKQVGDAGITSALTKVYQNTSIYERLDNLIGLIDACLLYHTKNPKNSEVLALQKQAEQFVAIITNTRELEQAIADRKKYRAEWPTFLPNTLLKQQSALNPNFDKSPTLQKLQKMEMERAQAEKEKVQTKTGTNSAAASSSSEQSKKQRTPHAHYVLGLFKSLAKRKLLKVNDEDLINDQSLNVTMLGDLEKEPYRILPAQGLLWQLQQPLDVKARLVIKPFDTAEMVAHTKFKGRAIFVLSPQGELFAGSSVVGKFHHSSFLKSGYVFYGGTLEAKNGRIDYIDDYSGHYGPGLAAFLKVLKMLKEKRLIYPTTLINKNYLDNPKGGAAVPALAPALNALGFLGLTGMAPAPKVPDDYFNLLLTSLINNTEESDPIWASFSVVMSEFLKDKTGAPFDEYKKNVAELLEGFDIDLAKLTADERQGHVDKLVQYINKDADLKWLLKDKIQIAEKHSSLKL
jgi:hypothetical protein